MESSQPKSGDHSPRIHRFVASTRVAAVEERFNIRWISGIGLDARVQRRSTGWWIITLAPEPSAFCVGDTRPPILPGDTVRLIYEIEEAQR